MECCLEFPDRMTALLTAQSCWSLKALEVTSAAIDTDLLDNFQNLSLLALPFLSNTSPLWTWLHSIDWPRYHSTGKIHYLLAQHSVATLLLTIPWLRQILSFFWPNTNLQSSDFQNLIISAHPWFQTHNFAQNLWVTTNFNLKQDKLQVSEWLSECPNYRPAGCFAYYPVTGGTSTSRVGPTNVSNDYFVCYQDLSEYVGLEYLALQ